MTNEVRKLAGLASGLWLGRECFVIGSGPSLCGFNFGLLENELTIGCNRAAEFFSPTILLTIDARFHDWMAVGKYGREAQNSYFSFKGLRVGIRISRAHAPGVTEIKSLGVVGPIVPVEEGIYHGNNSGYSAVALALAMGADVVYIMGIDLRYAGNATHNHDGHPEPTPEIELRRKCLPSFEALAKRPEGRRVRIVNLYWPQPNFSLLANLFDNVNLNYIFNFEEGKRHA